MNYLSTDSGKTHLRALSVCQRVGPPVDSGTGGGCREGTGQLELGPQAVEPGV